MEISVVGVFFCILFHVYGDGKKKMHMLYVKEDQTCYIRF